VSHPSGKFWTTYSRYIDLISFWAFDNYAYFLTKSTKGQQHRGTDGPRRKLGENIGGALQNESGGLGVQGQSPGKGFGGRSPPEAEAFL